jgi:alpha-1,3-mannosyltransferase
VYPAGFVYVYAALRRATGGSVAAAQPLFAALYVATLAAALWLTIAAGVVPPAALPLLCASKRLHSIYVLRLFNDPVAMLPAFAAVALAQRRRWCGRL